MSKSKIQWMPWPQANWANKKSLLTLIVEIFSELNPTRRFSFIRNEEEEKNRFHSHCDNEIRSISFLSIRFHSVVRALADCDETTRKHWVVEEEERPSCKEDQWSMDNPKDWTRWNAYLRRRHWLDKMPSEKSSNEMCDGIDRISRRDLGKSVQEFVQQRIDHWEETKWIA